MSDDVGGSGGSGGADEEWTGPLTFSEQLSDWLETDGTQTLGELGMVFGEKAFAVAVLLLMAPAALPLPTGGVTHVLEVVAILMGIEMVFGFPTIWLPRRWRQRPLGATMTGRALPRIIRMIRWLERFSRPRGAGALRTKTVRRLLGLVLIAFCLGALLAPPFSGLDTVPALGAVVVGLGIVLEDAVVLGIGVFLGIAGIVLDVVLGAAAVDLMRRLW